MRISDSLAVEVVLESGQVLHEVNNGGVTYVVASPGEKFSVRVTNHSRQAHHRVWLNVDGVAAGYTKVFRAGVNGQFDDIMLSAVGQDSQVKRLQFQDAAPSSSPAAQQAAAQPAALDSIKVGRITVEVVQVVDSGAVIPPPAHIANHHTAPGGIKLPDGKKWFLAPSLSAANGPTTARKTTWDTVDWREVSARTSHTLRYETASTLVLRGILQEDQPAHRALIQASLRQEAEMVAAAVVKAEPAGSSGGRNGAPSAGNQGQVGTSRQGAGGSGGKRAPMVDLSIEKDDEVLCDLTGEAPAWHWSKKPKIEID